MIIVNKYIKKYNAMSVVSKASLWALVSGVLQKGMSVLATPVFTRILTPDEYAQYALYQSWQDIIIIFVSLNIFNYCTYTAMAKFEKDRDGFITSAQTLVTVLTFFWMAVYFAVHLIAGDVMGFPLSIVLLMMLDILFMTSSNLWIARKRYDYQYRLMTMVSIFIGVMRPVMGLIIIHFAQNRGYGRIYGVACINIGVGMLLYIINMMKNRHLGAKKYWKYMITFCIPLIPHFLSSQVLSRFDRIMIGQMCVDTDVAIYSLAYNLAMLMMIVSDAILASITPWTYHSIKDNEPGKIKGVINKMVLLVAGANLILILFAPEAVRIFATNEYSGAIYIIPSVSASVYFMFLFNVFANIEYYYSETKYVAVASIIAAVLNVILNLIFIRKYGYIAAGYTTLASYILYSIGHFVFMRKVSRKYAKGYQYYDNRFLLLMSVGFTVVSLAIIPLYQLTWVRYALIIFVLIIGGINKKFIIGFIKK